MGGCADVAAQRTFPAQLLGVDMSEPASLSLSLVGFLFSMVATRYVGTSHHTTNQTESKSTTLIETSPPPSAK